MPALRAPSGWLLALLSIAGCSSSALRVGNDTATAASDLAAAAPSAGDDLSVATIDASVVDLAMSTPDRATIPDLAYHCLVPCVAGLQYCFWSACGGPTMCLDLPKDCLPQNDSTCACLRMVHPGDSKCGQFNGMIFMDCACSATGCQ